MIPTPISPDAQAGQVAEALEKRLAMASNYPGGAVALYQANGEASLVIGLLQQLASANKRIGELELSVEARDHVLSRAGLRIGELEEGLRHARDRLWRIEERKFPTAATATLELIDALLQSSPSKEEGKA